MHLHRLLCSDYDPEKLCLNAGEPETKKKVVCLHEEDAGLLWKHTEHRTAHCEQRRARRLVLSSICTLGNYDYSMNWYFYQVGGWRFCFMHAHTHVFSSFAVSVSISASPGTDFQQPMLRIGIKRSSSMRPLGH